MQKKNDNKRTILSPSNAPILIGAISLCTQTVSCVKMRTMCDTLPSNHSLQYTISALKINNGGKFEVKRVTTSDTFLVFSMHRS
jgi:hypothetical protein